MKNKTEKYKTEKHKRWISIEKFVRWMSVAMMAMGFFGMWRSSRRFFAAYKHTFALEQLPPQLDGVTIIHITDLHANENNVAVWEEILAHEGDLALFTGDFTTENQSSLLTHKPYMIELAKKMPVYYVFGNHERHNKEEIKQICNDSGWILLDMETAYFEKDGYSLPLIGVKDWYEWQRECFFGLEGLMDKVKDEFSIVLSHQPQIIDEMSTYPTFIFSGHTHGGQLRLPFLPVLYAPGQGILPTYGKGYYLKEKASLFVNSGIGTTHFPIRLFNPPEINIITLTTDKK